jgi:hypothetical protein
VTLKAGHHTLDGRSGLDAAQLARLREASITTVEHFVGAARADGAALARLLIVPVDEVERLRKKAEHRLNGRTRDQLLAPVPRYPLGAIRPDHTDTSRPH